MKKSDGRFESSIVWGNSDTPNDSMLASSHTLKPQIDLKIEAFLGENLRAAYDDVLNEPVPDRFISLLDNLVKKAEA